MEERITDLIRKTDPGQTEKPYYIAEVGEFPGTRMNNIPEHLPLEDPDMFSEDPLDFEESAVILREDVLEIYHYTMFLNRFSNKYQQVSRSLAKGIAKLASCCVTKTVLETKGFRFPKLDDLEIEGLYRCVSFNFRKCHAAVKGTKNNNYLMWAQLIDIEFGWHTLSERLKATEEKIRKIREGKINIDSMLSRARMFRQQPESDKPRTVRDLIDGPNANAYPVIGPVVREMLERSRAGREAKAAPVSAVSEQKDAKKQAEKQEKRVEKPSEKNLPGPSAPVITDKQKRDDEQYLDQIMRSMFASMQQKLERSYNPEKVPVPRGAPRPGRA